MNWSWTFTWEILPRLLHGLGQTVIATVFGSLLGAALGMIIAVARFVAGRTVNTVVQGYVYFVRGTPFLVQLYFIFFVLPDLGLLLSPMASGIVALGVMYSPYFGETFRAGLQSVGKGQFDAVVALGLPPLRAWVNIYIPQAVKPIAPAIGNYINSMFKVSALLFAISVQELFGTATTIGNSVFRYLEPMTMAAVFYLAVSIPVGILISHAQRRMRTNIA